MNQWHNKYVLITGAGSGIGRALARLFASYQAKLILTDINGDNLKQTCDELQSSVAIQQIADASSREDWQQLAAQIEEKIGHLDVLINNAGMTSFDYFDQTSEALFDKIMAVNFNGVVMGCRTMMPLLEKSQKATLVNVASIFSLVTLPMLTPYHASKFAVRGFTESLRQEMLYRKKNINVICVMPGGIKTNIANNAQSDTGDTNKSAEHFAKLARTTPEKAARVIEKGMRKNTFRVFIGSDAKFIKIINQLLPEFYFKIINPAFGLKKMLK